MRRRRRRRRLCLISPLSPFPLSDWSDRHQNLVGTFENCDQDSALVLYMGDAHVEFVAYAPWLGGVVTGGGLPDWWNFDCQQQQQQRVPPPTPRKPDAAGGGNPTDRWRQFMAPPLFGDRWRPASAAGQTPNCRRSLLPQLSEEPSPPARGYSTATSPPLRSASREEIVAEGIGSAYSSEDECEGEDEVDLMNIEDILEEILGETSRMSTPSPGAEARRLLYAGLTPSRGGVGADEDDDGRGDLVDCLVESSAAAAAASDPAPVGSSRAATREGR